VATIAAPSKAETAAPAATKLETVATSSSARSNSEVAQSPTATGALEATTAASSGSFLQRNLIWIGALVLAGILSVLFWMILRRSRSTAPVSLITRSLDREKK
jgi:sensor c-di-GMP phosphodiesterase-like protein